MSFTITSTDGTTLAIVQDGTANTKALGYYKYNCTNDSDFRRSMV